jgi:hypothetical protein
MRRVGKSKRNYGDQYRTSRHGPPTQNVSQIPTLRYIATAAAGKARSSSTPEARPRVLPRQRIRIIPAICIDIEELLI